VEKTTTKYILRPRYLFRTQQFNYEFPLGNSVGVFWLWFLIGIKGESEKSLRDSVPKMYRSGTKNTCQSRIRSAPKRSSLKANSSPYRYGFGFVHCAADNAQLNSFKSVNCVGTNHICAEYF